MATEIQCRHVKWRIGHEHLGDRSSVTGAIGNPQEVDRTARQQTAIFPQHVKKIDRLEKAIELFRQAVQVTPVNMSCLAKRFINLETSLRSR